MKKMSLLVCAALALTACSGSDGSDSDGESGDVNTVETAFGEVEVPADAERVVALGWGDAETALALGVQPVGASDWLDFGEEADGVGPWAEDLYDESPELIDTQEPDFEQIAELDPDVILDINSSGDEERYEKLDEIAPTVGIPEGGEGYLADRDQQVDMIAEALGKEDEGDQLQDDVEEKFEQVREEHPDFEGVESSVVAYSSDGWGAYIEGDARVNFLTQLGFKNNPWVAEQEVKQFSVDVSSEQLDEVDTELLVTVPIYVPDEDVTDQAGYSNLDAVQDNRHVFLGEERDDLSKAFSTDSILSVDYLLDEFPDVLQDAVDGDGD